MKYLVLVFIVSWSFSSCGFVRNEEIIDKYQLIAIDSDEDTHLGYEVGNGNFVGLVPSKIVAYAHDGEYIYVKQSPYPNEKMPKIYYYIVPIVSDTLNVYPEDKLIGPLVEKEFQSMLLNMNRKDLKFEEVN